MQQGIDEAARGKGEALEAFERLGLSAQSLRNVAPDEQIEQIADALAKVKDPAARSATAMDLFGRSGTALLPLLRQGSAGIRKLREDAQRLGLTMSREDAIAAHALGDAMLDVNRTLKMVAVRVGGAVAPMLTQMAKRIANAVVKVVRWVQANQGLIESIFKIALVVAGAGAGLAVLGGVISGLATVLARVLNPVVQVGIGLFRVLATVLPLMLTPAGAVVTALLALGGVLLWTTGTGAKALAWLGDCFATLRDDFLAAIGGIGDALAAGNIGLAVKILWLTIKMEWTRGINFLERAWLNFRNFFIKLGYDAWYGVKAAADIVWHNLVVGWIETCAWFNKAIADVGAFFARIWEGMKAVATKVWNWIKSLFDDSIDLSAANAEVERKRQEAVDRINAEKNARKSQVEERRREEREGETKRHEAYLAKTARDNQERQAALDAAYNRRIAEQEQELAAARKEWQDAIAKAREEKEAARAKRPAGPKQPEFGDFGAAEMEKVKTRAQGTFYAFAVSGLAAGTATTLRIAVATERTARNTDRLLNRGAPSFT